MLGAVRVGDFQKRLKPWKACEWQDWGYRQKSSGSLREVVGTKGSGPRGWTGTAQNSEMRRGANVRCPGSAAKISYSGTFSGWFCVKRNSSSGKCEDTFH